MELVIQTADFHSQGTPPPSPGDIFGTEMVIEPHGERRQCALDTLASGITKQELARVVVRTRTFPTLDDMLAGSFAKWLAEGKALGESAQLFARYAALVRSGYAPSRLPAEVSLEGVYAALTWGFEGHLKNAEEAAAFVRAWEPMAEVIGEAIEKGVDPFSTQLFSEASHGGAFAEQIVRLRADKKVYAQDVKNGNRFRIHFDGAKGAENSALYLREPKSLLFKQWARSDVTSPSLDGYLVLLVKQEGGEWVISSDPAQHLSLAGLARLLEEAAGRKGFKEEWFDGKPFGHSLIGAPLGGTKLSEAEVLGVFEKYARAKELVKPRGRGAWMPLGIGAVAAAGLLCLGYVTFHAGGELPVLDPAAGATELDELHTMPLAARGGMEGSPNLGLFVGINEFRQDQFPALSFAVDDAIAQAHLFSLELKLIAPENVTLALAGEPGSMRDVRMLKELKAAGATVTGADSGDILDDLQRLKELSLLNPNDPGNEKRMVVVSISTHGIELEGTPYIVPHNIAMSDPGRTAIAVKELTDRMEACRASKRLLVIDACRTAAHAANKGGPETMPVDFATMLREAKGEGTMASCSTGQSSYELRDKGHGLFTYWLLLALKGSAPADGSGFITVGSVEKYLSEKVTRYSLMNAPSKQEPFFVLTSEAEGIPLAIPGD